MSLAKFLQYRYKLGWGDAMNLYPKMRSKGEREIRLGTLEHPVHLRNVGDDYLVLEEILVGRIYQIPWKLDIKTIVDAGANIGIASVYFANRYKQAHIVSIEPDGENYRMLQKNTSAYGRVTCLQKGVWHESTLLKLVKNANPIELQVEPTTNPEEAICDAVSMNAIMEQQGWDSIDLVKMDVQGAEAAIFSQHTEWLSKTKVIILELHENHVPLSSQVTVGALLQHGFRFFIYHNLLYCLHRDVQL